MRDEKRWNRTNVCQVSGMAQVDQFLHQGEKITRAFGPGEAAFTPGQIVFSEGQK